MRVFPDTNVLFSVRLINLIMRTHEARIINESSAALRRPPKTPEVVLNDLEEIGLVEFARAVRTELRP